MVGCLARAYFGLPSGFSRGFCQYVIKVVLAKANQPWGAIFLKGIGGNFMVCLGVWQFTCAEDRPSCNGDRLHPVLCDASLVPPFPCSRSSMTLK
jgi:hypothetical protein